MSQVPRSRVVLVLSLAVLASSVAVFGSVTGIAPDETHEFTVEDGAVVATTGSGQHVLVEDAHTIDRIEISHEDSRYLVQTVDHGPPPVDAQMRLRVRQIITSAEIVGGDIPSANGTAYAVRRVPSRLSSDRAAVIGATSNESLQTVISPNASAFTVRQDDGSIVFERRESWWSVDRMLVVVTSNEPGTRYSAVVNLRTETIESLVRLDGGDR
ncbi:hypothetical protein ACFPM1_10975 [Halorubrum rubrum]|uniref:DUF4340 domain-containing protein n=1 Tax=Halorubrum rubrum TaxID=1126240 RepID=A0ABD5R359_9EURY|nr:hypothetical protein [Halorubrum rubrum]